MMVKEVIFSQNEKTCVNWQNQQKSGRPERGSMGSTGLKRKSVQGRQSEMSTHREKFFWTRVKLEKLIISTILESTSIKHGRGVINIRSKRILEGHYQSMREK